MHGYTYSPSRINGRLYVYGGNLKFSETAEIGRKLFSNCRQIFNRHVILNGLTRIAVKGFREPRVHWISSPNDSAQSASRGTRASAHRMPVAKHTSKRISMMAKWYECQAGDMKGVGSTLKDLEILFEGLQFSASAFKCSYLFTTVQNMFGPKACLPGDCLDKAFFK